MLCNQIAAVAWQQLENATWPKLTEVSFYGRLGEDTFRSVRGSLVGMVAGMWEGFEVAGARPFHKKRVV